MDDLKIAMVGYLNTLPFEYGLKQITSKYNLKLLLDVPSKCAQYFKSGEVDLALVPVGVLPDLEEYEICLDYCIACDGPVRTVGIFSHSSPSNWHTVYLDEHSRTSRVLAQIILKEGYGLNPVFKNMRISKMAALKEGEAVLMIGDKVFTEGDKYQVSIDLGAAWKELTGIPFVFALWVKRKGIKMDDTILNQALSFGMQKIPVLIKAHAPTSILSEEEVDTYITQNLKYELLPNYMDAVHLFMDKINSNEWY